MRIILKPLGAITVLVMFCVLAALALSNAGKKRNETASTGRATDILIVTDAAKKSWLLNQVYRFNLENGGKYHVTTRYMDSREALQAIVSDREKPVIWSSSGANWAGALADGWQKSHPGAESVVALNDSASLRSYLQTPIVFLTVKNKVASLKTALGSNVWDGLHRASVSEKSIRYSYANPVTSNAGFATLGLILSDYAKRSGSTTPLTEVANSSGFVSHLREMNRGYVTVPGADTDSATLCAAFARGGTKCDMVVAYESDALTEAAKNPNLAVIYPEPTALTSQSVAVLHGEWVTPEQTAGAKAFLDFLGSETAIKDGVRLHYRPMQATDKLTLEPELAARRGQGFQSQYSATDLPSYTAINNADFQWHTHIAKK